MKFVRYFVVAVGFIVLWLMFNYLQIAISLIAALMIVVVPAALNRPQKGEPFDFASFEVSIGVAVVFSLMSCAVIIGFVSAETKAHWLAVFIQGVFGGIVGLIAGKLWQERHRPLQDVQERSVDAARVRARG
ncbi:hypothetical protein IYR97_23790 (plasmid) [Pseudomonas fulva]|uniref:Uncharacterized protein n=2 Tax=Pseudomonas putida group TaxID=136845 RepID=A0ABD7BNU4_PSEPU|nr:MULTISPECIES: hypothetical protein [Pseudomonas putida group]QOD01545.1 hypothetical protein ID616_30450 [Pseudomonas putida]QPH46819.1 hypothetical protein IYR97_23790 [Pseudomonas fulva]QPH51992.1 hypothetical protein IZU98_24240 [Pseudomonas fulva]